MIIDTIIACAECGEEMILEHQTCRHNKRTMTWEDYTCPKCGYFETTEPDWDSMTGGKDEY
jgi:predicted RNA-binding Zn-ribbon protein involved in translation (DUF1610 family)